MICTHRSRIDIILFQNQWGFIDFELSEKNVRIYDPCYASTALLTESFDEKDESRFKAWISIYRHLFRGYDETAHLIDAEKETVPYVILANQLVCVAWFSGRAQPPFSEILDINKRMTRCLLSHFDALMLK